MFLLTLFVAHAGNLEVTLTVDDDDVRTVTFQDLPSCTPVRTSISGDTGWSVRALATANEPDGDITVEINIEAWSERGRNERRVKSNPVLRIRPNEEATISMSGPEGSFSMTVLATDFEIDPSCLRSGGGRPPPGREEGRRVRANLR
jgi:hypothetical protein